MSFARPFSDYKNDYREVKRRLGKGSFGTVDVVERKTDNKKFAAKYVKMKDNAYA